MGIFSDLKNRFSKKAGSYLANPYAEIKTQYYAMRIFVIIISLIIAVTIIIAIIKMNSRFSAMTLLVQAAMVLVGFFIIQKMYFIVLSPIKKTLEHYEVNPSTQTTKFVDVGKEVDDILNEFDDKEKNARAKKE